jgi:hypothetical protein
LAIGLFSPTISFGQDQSKADTDAVLQTEKVKPEAFSFRGIRFGSGVNEISGLVMSKDAHSVTRSNDPLTWYLRKDEKPINGVKVTILFGFYKEKLIKLVITSQHIGDATAIDEALKKKYGNPQVASEICKKKIAKLWLGHDPFWAVTNNGRWEESFPRREDTTGPSLQLWWLFNDRVLMRNYGEGTGAYIEIKDVPLLIEAMRSAQREYKEQVNKAADKAAKNDF